eukprot:EG_transcript_7963
MTWLLHWGIWLSFMLPRGTTIDLQPRKGWFVFALWQNDKDSTVGAIANARLVPTVLKGWGTQFYVDASNVSSNVTAALRQYGALVVTVQPSPNLTTDPALWPFWAADTSPGPICIRTVLGRPSLREATIVALWLRSSFTFHTIRDNYFQDPRREPHLWCAKAGGLPTALGTAMHSFLAAGAESAPTFMQDRLYPAIIPQTLCQDAYDCAQFHSLPVARRLGGFIGQHHNHLGVPGKLPIGPRGLWRRERACTRPAWLHLISQSFLPDGPMRRREIIDVLHSWLRNPNVLKVHLLGRNRSHFDQALAGLAADQQKRVVFVPLSRQMLYEDAFGYASSGAFADTPCMVLNSDISLGLGFNQLGWEYVEQLRPYLFSLSRHPSPHCMDGADECDVYVGSHDAFLFVPPISAAVRKRLAFRQNLKGSESALMLEVRHERKLWNPCRQLIIHHFHCTDERAWRDRLLPHGRRPPSTTVHRRVTLFVKPRDLPFPLSAGQAFNRSLLASH